MEQVVKLGMAAKEASRLLRTTGAAQKHKALLAIADSLLENTSAILLANAADLEAAQEAGISNALLDRLALSPDRIRGMAEGVRSVAALPDPVSEIIGGGIRPNGLKIERIRVPLGVVGIIYEARPNVTSDAAALCLKAGNAVILRGGKEAILSNTAITLAIQDGLFSAGLPKSAVSLIEDTSRESARALMELHEYLDVLIPRGGAGLIRSVVESARVPVVETGVGNCHVYVDRFADMEMASKIIFNAKTSRPSVCNAIETVLLDCTIATAVLPIIYAQLKLKNVAVVGCPETCRILPEATPATEEDYYTEFGDYKLAIKIVEGIDAAMAHIEKYGSGHSECIVTDHFEHSQRFLAGVDAAAVYVNASTRFTDGAEFGLGAEIGISTQKLHARGPMGIHALTSEKYLVTGNGQIR